MKKTGLNIYIYDFYVDYDAIAVDDMLDIQKYLMKKKMFGFIKKSIFYRINNFIKCKYVECKFFECSSAEMHFNE